VEVSAAKVASVNAVAVGLAEVEEEDLDAVEVLAEVEASPLLNKPQNK
jgi:hypothetical protein